MRPLLRRFPLLGALQLFALLGTVLLGAPTATATATGTPPPVTVSLPIDTLDNSVPLGTVLLKPVATTNIDAGLNYIGFEGDLTFNKKVCTFSSVAGEKAGLTSGSWTVSGNILPGPG